MKKYICFASVFILLKVANGQTLSLSFNGSDATNKSILVEGKANDEVIKASLVITNNGNDNINVKVRKIHNSIVDGTQNSFCLGQCYQPTTYESTNPFLIEKGQSTGKDVFYIEYFPNGNAGSSQIKYEVFDTNNPETNKVWVVITFTAESTSGIDNRSEKFTLSAYPNPANGQKVTINYYLPSGISHGKLVIRNILGVIVYTENLTDNQGKIVVDLGDFTKGIYFYSLIVDDKSLATKKLFVNK